MPQSDVTFDAIIAFTAVDFPPPLIEALEERNKSQLESFVDEQDQWESLEEEERQLLLQKDEITQRMEAIAEELVQIWMGSKSMEG